VVTNQLSIVGKLTKNAEFKSGTTENGLWQNCKFNLVVETELKRKMEVYTEKVYIDCTIWGEEAQKYLSLGAGSVLSIKGRFKMESWKDKDGNTKSRPTIVPALINIVKEVAISDTEIMNATNRKPETAPDDDLPF